MECCWRPGRPGCDRRGCGLNTQGAGVPPCRWSGTARLYRGMSLAQTPPGLPLTRRSPRRGPLVGGSRRGSPCQPRSARRSAAAPTSGNAPGSTSAGALLPLFCPIALDRGAQPRITLDDQPACTPADQGGCDSGEPCRTDLDVPHSVENRKVGGSIPSLPTTSAQVRPSVASAATGYRPRLLVSGGRQAPRSAPMWPDRRGSRNQPSGSLRQRFEDVTVRLSSRRHGRHRAWNRIGPSGMFIVGPDRQRRDDAHGR